MKPTQFYACICICLIAGCGVGEFDQDNPKPVPITVAKPLVKPIVEWDEYTGRLQSIDSVEIRARVSGYLQSITFDEGQSVKQGDLLAVIDPRPFRAEYNAAEARLAEAEAHLSESQALLRQAEAEKLEAKAAFDLATTLLNRGKSLNQRGAISQEELDTRQSTQLQAAASVEATNAKVESARAGIATAAAAIDTAKAGIESAALNLDYTEIHAPISGRISRRYVTEGNLISGGNIGSTLLTTIVSLNPIHVYFDANEQEFLKYVRLAQSGKRRSSREAKNPVLISLVDEAGYPHRGHMDFVDNQLDPNTATMRGRAILRNDDGLLTPGLFVKVRLPGSGRYDAVLIPDSAIGSDQSERFVYVVDSESASDSNEQGVGLRRITVELGPIVQGLRVIRKGLSGNEQIVTRGLQLIRSGMRFAPETEDVIAEPSDLPDDYEPVPKDEWIPRRLDSTSIEEADQDTNPSPTKMQEELDSTPDSEKDGEASVEETEE